MDIVRPITKWADWCRTPADVKPMLDMAYRMSLRQRPGPSWLDIPVDVQWQSI